MKYWSVVAIRSFVVLLRSVEHACINLQITQCLFSLLCCCVSNPASFHGIITYSLACSSHSLNVYTVEGLNSSNTLWPFWRGELWNFHFQFVMLFFPKCNWTGTNLSLITWNLLQAMTISYKHQSTPFHLPSLSCPRRPLCTADWEASDKKPFCISRALVQV